MTAQLTWTVWCCFLLCGTQGLTVSNDVDGEVYPPVHNADTRDLESLTLSKITFTYADASTIDTTTLKMCSDEEMSTSDTAVVTLVFGSADRNEYNIRGSLVDEKKCAEFSIDFHVPETTDATIYALIVEEDGVAVNRITTVFAVTVDVTVLACGESTILSRVSLEDSDATLVDDKGTCIASDSLGPNICYREEDLTDLEVCFTTTGTGELEICTVGAAVNKITDSTDISAVYLAYDPSTPDSPAKLSLSVPQTPTEVTLWKDTEDPEVITCSDSICDLTPFTASDSIYKVCAVWDEGLLRAVQSGDTTVQDVNLVAYEMPEDPPLIEFAFTNANADTFLYIASLYTVNQQNPPTPVGEPVHLNCEGVQQGNKCFGFISAADVDTSMNTYYVGVDYTDKDFELAPIPNNIATKVQSLDSGSGGNLASRHTDLVYSNIDI